MKAYWTIPLLAAMAGCADTQVPSAQASTRPTAYAVNYPLQYMARRIGGDVVDVVFPCPAGVDPADWRPDDATVEAFQRADLVLLNGAGYAGWMRVASLPPSRLVDTSASFREDYIVSSHDVTHGHGPDGEQTHGRIARTTWLDPVQAIAQARAIRGAFTARWPEHRGGFEGNRFRSRHFDFCATFRAVDQGSRRGALGAKLRSAIITSAQRRLRPGVAADGGLSDLRRGEGKPKFFR